MGAQDIANPGVVAGVLLHRTAGTGGWLFPQKHRGAWVCTWLHVSVTAIQERPPGPAGSEEAN